MLPAVPPIVIGAFFRCSAHLLVAFPSSSTAKEWLSPHPYPHPQTDRAARRRKRVPHLFRFFISPDPSCQPRSRCRVCISAIDDPINQWIGINGGGKMSR
ncbi:hypothetical protein QZM43_24770 [Burkholderia orbicola]|uniref:hypothetical protein n=1 Tax=Burkholderia cepacia complex TaxID=87882 RepID=UPI002012DD44|nr:MULTISPECIES: hypothetical protein [Burkholderia cepacia complex]MDN7467099.1 hypothetical protein [Burkholderia orbicola]MDN7505948.1 hypothetical protein [Burkholderia orbicola]